MTLQEALTVLEIKGEPTQQAVRDAYREMVKVWHPDRFAEDPKFRLRATRKTQEINTAYEVVQAHFDGAAPPEGTPESATEYRTSAKATVSEEDAVLRKAYVGLLTATARADGPVSDAELTAILRITKQRFAHLPEQTTDEWLLLLQPHLQYPANPPDFVRLAVLAAEQFRHCERDVLEILFCEGALTSAKQRWFEELRMHAPFNTREVNDAYEWRCYQFGGPTPSPSAPPVSQSRPSEAGAEEHDELMRAIAKWIVYAWPISVALGIYLLMQLLKWLAHVVLYLSR